MSPITFLHGLISLSTAEFWIAALHGVRGRNYDHGWEGKLYDTRLFFILVMGYETIFGVWHPHQEAMATDGVGQY